MINIVLTKLMIRQQSQIISLSLSGSLCLFVNKHGCLHRFTFIINEKQKVKYRISPISNIATFEILINSRCNTR